MARCAELEGQLEAIKARYEQFFLGLTRLPPRDDHAAFRAAMNQFAQASTRNTSVRFRAQSLQNRLLSYERMWQRVCREIEEGTWRKDLYKARLRAPREIRTRKADGGATEGEGGKSVGAVGSRQVGGEAESAAGRVDPRQREGSGQSVAPGPVRSTSAGLSDAELRPLYDAYISARRRCRESTEGLSYESLAGSLRRQVPTLLEKHGASTVEFKVVIKDGKAAVRALPK